MEGSGLLEAYVSQALLCPPTPRPPCCPSYPSQAGWGWGRGRGMLLGGQGALQRSQESLPSCRVPTSEARASCTNRDPTTLTR